MLSLVYKYANVPTPNYTELDVPTPNYTELDVPTPNYQDPDSPPSPPTIPSPVAIIYPPTEEEFVKNMIPHKAFFNVAHFITSVSALAALLSPVDPNAICTTHLPICLWGYGALLALLASRLRIVTTGLNGASGDMVFGLWRTRLRAIWENSAIAVVLEDCYFIVWLAYTYFWSPNVHQYFARYRYVLFLTA